MHLSSNPAIWYAIRASGVLAFVLLTCTVLVGVGLAGKVRLARWPRFTVDALHRYLGTLFWVFLGVHVVTTAVDSYVSLSIADIVVPFASSYRSLGLGLGIAATELLLALAIVNRMRDKLSYGFWRRAHYVNFAVWVGSTLHGLLTGTDSLVPLYAAAIASVTAAVGLRGHDLSDVNVFESAQARQRAGDEPLLPRSFRVGSQVQRLASAAPRKHRTAWIDAVRRTLLDLDHVRRDVVALDLVDRNPHALAGKSAGNEDDQAVDPPDSLTVLEQVLENDRISGESGGVGLSRAVVRQGF